MMVSMMDGMAVTEFIVDSETVDRGIGHAWTRDREPLLRPLDTLTGKIFFASVGGSGHWAEHSFIRALRGGRTF